MKRSIFLPVILLALVSSNSYANNHMGTNPSNGMAMSNQNQKMDAIEIILQDHNQIRRMISELNKTLNSNVAQSRSMFNDLKNLLIKHETMEQKVWYPELEKYNELKDIISHLKKEEQEAGDLITKLDGITNDKEWISNVKKLNKAVGQHANEEENKLFPKVRKVLNKSALEEIGSKISDYKKQNGR